MSFLALKSRADCDGLIAFNRGEACAKTECSCKRSKENRIVSSPKSKLLLIPINFFSAGKNDHFVSNSKFSSESEVVLTSTIDQS